jgi:hypothetical protein
VIYGARAASTRIRARRSDRRPHRNPVDAKVRDAANAEAMADDQASADAQAVTELDRAWNEVYLRNDRSAFARILADDFRVNLSDGRTGGKADLMRPTPEGARVVFSEAGMQMFAPTAVTWGRVQIQHPDRVVDQRYLRVYSKRVRGWQAVFVATFAVGADG